MLGRDGKFAWLRRYVADAKVSDIERAATTRDGKLLFVTRERMPTTTTPTISLVTTDSTAAALVAARGNCLDPRWQKAVDADAQLHRRGLWVMPPQTAKLTSSGKACSTREKEFVDFMHALAAAVPETAVQSPGTRQRIVVRVTSSGSPIRLETYSADRSGGPTAGEMLVFVVPFDRAAQFWKIVATQARPHLDRMRALDERFVQMTGFMYVVSAQGDLDYARTFAELEKAARAVDARIAGIPPVQIAGVRRFPPNGWVSVLLQPEGFGASSDSLHPFDVADRTFLDIVAEHRRRAAQGEIIIRD